MVAISYVCFAILQLAPVAYVCTENSSLFLMSRNRVAPIKTKIIPQIELTAVLLCCRLAKYVKALLNCNLKIFVRSDNRIPCLYFGLQ